MMRNDNFRSWVMENFSYQKRSSDWDKRATDRDKEGHSKSAEGGFRNDLTFIRWNLFHIKLARRIYFVVSKCIAASTFSNITIKIRIPD